MVFATFSPILRERFVSLVPAKWLFLGICSFVPGHLLHAQGNPSVQFSSSQRTLPMVAQNPIGMAVDQSGNIYVADQVTGTVTEDVLSGDVYTSSVILTGFKSPTGIAVDQQGNLYITEDAHAQSGPDDVVKESVTATHSGNTYTANVLPVNSLGSPAAIAVDQAGTVYVADSLNNKIYALTPAAGGYVQRTLPTSPLAQPTGVAVDTSGNVFIADSDNVRLLKETVSGSGYTETTLSQYNGPVSVAVDRGGTVYFICSACAAGSVLQETPADGGYRESPVALAHIALPTAIAANKSGTFYAVSAGNNQLAQVTTSAGDAGPALLSTTSLPLSLVFTSEQDGVQVGTVSVFPPSAFADAGTGSCNNPGPGGFGISFAGTSCSVDVLFDPSSPGTQSGAVLLNDAGGKTLATGYVHGTGVAPFLQYPAEAGSIPGAFSHPTGMAVDTNQYFYFTESGTGKVYQAYQAFHIDPYSIEIAAGLADPVAVAVDPAGTLYVGASHAIYKEVPVSQYLGIYNQTEILGGLDHLAGMAIDGSGNFYLISSTAGDVRKETLNSGGSYTETSLGSAIANPSGIAADVVGNAYVTDARQGSVYKQTLQEDGSYQQSVIASGLNGPEGVTVDGMGNVYVAVSGAGAVYEFVLQTDGSYQQTVEATGLPMAWGVAVDQLGLLYVTQNLGDGSVLFAFTSNPPVLSFANTRVGSMSADSPQFVALNNRGNAPLVFEDDPFFPLPAVAAGFALSEQSTCPGLGGALAPGKSCTYGFNFLPQAQEMYSDYAIISEDNLDHFYPNPEVAEFILTGQGLSEDTTRTTLHISHNPVKAALGVTMAIAVTDTFAPSAIPVGDVTVSDTLGSATTILNGGAAITLNQGKATWTATFSSPGTHTITAHYNGVNGSFSGSTFSLTLTVQP